MSPRSTAYHTATAELLREHGLRVTWPRVSVLNVLAGRGHLDANSVARLVRGNDVHIATQTVYDALKTLTAAGLLRRTGSPGSALRYERRVGDNHHHLICRQCERVLDVDCIIGSAPCLTLADDHGFDIDEAAVTFWGVCPDCKNTAGQDTSVNRGRTASKSMKEEK
ncbi:MAG: transcriptional repressor [Propionibacteriaceae bacterium]|jgi:Fur family ferric uptake transcriptional regulator|nr:transcriptional repressor [Propionibacteriaceae bacterium]